MLPDEVLLAIFDFHVAKYQDLDFVEVMLSDYDMETKIRSWQLVSFPSVSKIEFESESCRSENICCTKFLERLVTFVRAGVGKGHVT